MVVTFFDRFLIGPVFVIVALNVWPKYMRAKIVNAVDISITFLAQAFLLVNTNTVTSHSTRFTSSLSVLFYCSCAQPRKYGEKFLVHSAAMDLFYEWA